MIVNTSDRVNKRYRTIAPFGGFWRDHIYLFIGRLELIHPPIDLRMVECDLPLSTVSRIGCHLMNKYLCSLFSRKSGRTFLSADGIEFAVNGRVRAKMPYSSESELLGHLLQSCPSTPGRPVAN